RLGPRAYPGTSLRSAVDWDPLALAPTLTHDAQLAGVEAAMWCETVTDFDDLQFLLQPRLAGVAERAWSQQDTFDWPDYRTRLAHQAPRWRSEGWNFFRGASVDWR
ncbi:MAG TPA: family 20 glycosylhydrolase, partial [Ilumatobacteraceae bacterium]|nr:family 20 glycosylhydrolase [Ilumatobacteraceae bacterium]